MKVFRDVAGPCATASGSVVAIGAFDGLHLGHQALLERVRERAAKLHATPGVISFEPLPREFFGTQPLPRLGSVRDKLQGLERAQMELTLLLRFNAALVAMPAEDFVRQVLVARMGVREVWVGADFRFGHKRAGDLDLLKHMGASLGFRACAMDSFDVDARRVSSSRIRELLQCGEFEQAGQLLGRPFAIGGRVARGRELGRELGYATANIYLGRRISPVHGIFAVRVGFDDGPCAWPGVASLGVRPTVNEVREPLLEAHLFDFDGDLYGRHVRVAFVEKLRDEVKFDDLDALKAQMDHDADQARAVLAMDTQLTGA